MKRILNNFVMLIMLIALPIGIIAKTLHFLTFSMCYAYSMGMAKVFEAAGSPEAALTILKAFENELRENKE